MSQSNDTLAPSFVAADRYQLLEADSFIQDFSNDCESLAFALGTIDANDPATKGIIVAVRAALFSYSEQASELSAGLMADLILLPELEVADHD